MATSRKTVVIGFVINLLFLQIVAPAQKKAAKTGWIEANPRLPSREGYEYFLRNVALIPFTPEQLVVMGRQEWERSIAFEAIAQERAKGLPELAIVPDQATQMICEEEAENRIRRFLEEENILTVPKWMQHYRNLPLPPTWNRSPN